MDGMLVKVTKYLGDTSSFLGNAIFFKKDFKDLAKKNIWLKEYFEIDPDFTDIPNLPRAAITARLKLGQKILNITNAHLAWGPTQFDEPYKIKQAEILYKSLVKQKKPFILAGDFNVIPSTKTASMFDKLGRNLVKENGITNTLNERKHPAKVLFPPGIAVDYVFVSDDILVKKFKTIDNIDLSDHLGLLLEFEI
jgi:endonuclease/exonuclease/phosphatase family metal-dependent hydrolase